MAFFTSAIDTLKILVIALVGLRNPKGLAWGGGPVGATLIPLLSGLFS